MAGFYFSKLQNHIRDEVKRREPLARHARNCCLTPFETDAASC